jgi:O-antigen/teichoic acid export membrane protein
MIREVLGQSIVYGLAIILSRGMLMIALLGVALFLPPADYGALVMITTIGFLVNVTVALEISQGLARYYAGASETDKRIYSSTAWWFTVLMFVLFIATSEFAAGYLCQLILGDDRYLNALRYALVVMSLNGIFYFMQCQFRWEFRSRDYAVVSFVYAVSSLGGSIGLGLIVDPAIDGVVFGQLLGSSVAVALGGRLLRASITCVFDIHKLKEMLQFSIPLVPASISLFVGLYASRIILNSVDSLEEVGIFGFASQIAGVTLLAIVGIQAALTPLIMARHSEPETPAKLARLFEGFTALAICACLGMGLFAREFIYLVGSPAYATSAPLVLILAPAVIINGMYIFAPGLSIARKTIWQLWISLASAGLGVLASYWFIRMWGIYGAAFATLLSAVFFLVMWFAVSQKLYPIPVRWTSVGLALLGAAVVGAIGNFMVEQGFAMNILIKLFLIIAIIVFFIFIKLIKMADICRVLTMTRR